MGLWTCHVRAAFASCKFTEKRQKRTDKVLNVQCNEYLRDISYFPLTLNIEPKDESAHLSMHFSEPHY